MIMSFEREDNKCLMFLETKFPSSFKAKTSQSNQPGPTGSQSLGYLQVTSLPSLKLSCDRPLLCLLSPMCPWLHAWHSDVNI